MADKSIRKTSPAVDAMSGEWDMVNALMEGTAAMREAGTRYLPQWPAEEDEVYQCRLKQAVLHPVFKRTVLVNAARPFAKPITLGDDTPANIKTWTGDADLQGTDLAALCSQLMVACLSKGLIGVLVDFPKSGQTRTKADERASGARPYLAPYLADTILGWRTELTPTGLQLTQLRLLEEVEEDDGEFGTEKIEQVRLLTPGKWAVFRENEKNPDIWDEVESGTTSLDFVPFVFFYGIRKAYGIGRSPLSDLAYQNVEHWQSASDQQMILHVARVPILFAKNLGDGKIAIGAGSCVTADGEFADMKYVEHSGAAIAAGKDSLIDLQDRMRATGAELVSLDVGYTTATEVFADTDASKSLLQQIVENFEESVQECLDYMADWVGEKTGHEVTLHKDFSIAADTDPQTLTGAVGTKTVSRQTHFEEMQRRDILSPDRTWDDEKVRLAEDSTVDAANAALQARVTAGDNTRNPGPGGA